MRSAVARNNVTEVSAQESEFFSNGAIEGQSLADRMAQGDLPAEDALRYAIDIGSALNRAHKRGAVHGKLSPHAILLTVSGARIIRPIEGTDLDALPYRSPEQVSGQPADRRSDVFSFGVLLYEMVSGRRAFAGEGAALDQSILEQPPAILLCKSQVLAAMEGVIAGCLEKDPARRYQRVQNAVIELRLTRLALAQHREAVQASARMNPAGGGGVGPKRPGMPGMASRHRLTLWLLLGASVLLIAAGAWILWQLSHAPPVQVIKFSIAPPKNMTYRMPAVSPDGRYVAVQSEEPGGQPMLWLHALDAMKPWPIPGTESGFAPFWSPDSQYLAFFADRALKKVRLIGMSNEGVRVGPVERICDSDPLPSGGAWNRSGTIVFAPGQGQALYRVSANGGNPQPLQKLDAAKHERAHIWPQFLPDGNHFIFFLLSDSPAATGVYTGSLDSPDYTLLFQSQTNAVYSPPAAGDSSKHGYLLYIRERSLIGVGFDAARLRLAGEPVALADDVGSVQSLSLAPISISRNATLVYQSVSPASRQLSWMDRSGKALVRIKLGGNWGPPRISPDGTRAVVARAGEDRKNADLWLVDDAGNATQFTGGPAHKGFPVWSPDGSRVAYFSNLDGSSDLVVSPANAGSKAEPLFRSAPAKYPTDWSRDGKYLLFAMLSEGTRSDVWAMSMTDRRAAPVLDTVYSEGYAVLSPDGKWFAFQSDESGRNQVYVQPFDGIARGTTRRYSVSTEAGGGLPRWRADGKEILYLTNSGRMMSVAVHPEGEEFQHDPPQPVFQTRTVPNTWNLFDVAPSGERFLMNLPFEWPNASPITVVTNWTAKVRE